MFEYMSKCLSFCGFRSSIDGDSDSIDCKTPQKTHLMPPPTPQQYQQARLKQRSNGAISKAHSLGYSNGIIKQNHVNGKVTSTSSNPKRLNGKSASCDMNGGSRSSSSSSTNGVDHQSASTSSNGQGSPSRSQLGLKLSKANNTQAVKKQSPLQVSDIEETSPLNAYGILFLTQNIIVLSARYVPTLPKMQMFLKNTSIVPISIHLVQVLTSHPRQHRTTTLVPLMLYNALFVPEYLILRLI